MKRSSGLSHAPRFSNLAIASMALIALTLLGGCCGGGSGSSGNDNKSSSSDNPSSIKEGEATEKEAIATDKCMSSSSESACASCCRSHGVKNHAFVANACVCMPGN